ncbi:flagellar hook-length control protein FliK [Alkalihalobacillus sp. BA299]|uniref:flagellar hook-length control protein FliK n=1 Tax=Alkalihalobacillus sp. BA299 TaxID=2815938 RepID=UPI001ADA20FF|nr:flagellar hook-length control protein FliK [Alkalihalobacillus sp. BA299]
MNIVGVINPSLSMGGVGSNEARGTSDRKSSFSQILGSLPVDHDRGDKVHQLTIETGIDDQEDAEEKLLAVLQSLAAVIPFEEGFLTKDKLNDSDVRDLLLLLPEELKLEIESIFHSELPIEALLQSVDVSKQPANMLTFLITLKRSSSDRLFSTKQDFTQFMKHIEQLFKTVETLNTAEIKNPRDVILQLIQALQKEEQRVNQSQFLQSLMQRMRIGENKQDGPQGVTINTDGQSMSRVQQLVIHIGEQPTREAEQRQFLRQFQEILGRGVFKNLNNQSQISIKLFPEHLGRLDIRISQINGVITARILSSSSTARDLIESQLQQLRHAFSQQQLNVERIEVAQQQQQLAGDLNRDGQGRQGDRDQDEQQEKESEIDKESFSQLLDELTINEKV